MFAAELLSIGTSQLEKAFQLVSTWGTKVEKKTHVNFELPHQPQLHANEDRPLPNTPSCQVVSLAMKDIPTPKWL